MEEAGMTDLQFKSFLKQLIRNLESAKANEDKKKKDEKIDEIIKDLESTIES